jgi:quinoprotein dehydrogenase-associated probable ABC transporter substrate-binding protein
MMQRLLAACAVCAVSACLAVLPAQAQTAAPEDAPPARKTLKVCQDPNNMPFSNLQGEGIENKMAELFGKALGLPVSYFSFPQRLAFVRNTLRYKLPGEDFRCDILMGVPVGFDQVSVTKPIYRSTYAMVFAKGRGLDGVKSQADFLALDKAVLQKLRIGVYDKSPASEWLNRHQLTEQGVPYPIMSPDPQQYPGEIIEKDLSGGKIDVAIVWGPIAGYFTQRVKTPELVLVPMRSEPGVRFAFQMAMGVRYGEREWKQQIEGLIDSQRAGIDAILKEFGVPLVDESFELRRN